MLDKIPFNKILFLDIETVPESEYWDDLSENLQKLWTEKTQWQRKDEVSPSEFYNDRGGIMAEFGKIVCISCGIILDNGKFRVKSFYGHNEQYLLQDFADLLETKFFTPQHILCAHNGKEFDFPFIARRMIVNGIKLPMILNLYGKKPWEVNHLDTMELWKFGDYKHYTSIKLLAEILGIPTPKDDIDGSEVSHVYYKENDLERIKIYCEKDTLTVAQIFRKLRYESLLEVEKE
ncbi:MAG: 3'-5' exonuclease [Flavobacteriales bacterium]